MVSSKTIYNLKFIVFYCCFVLLFSFIVFYCCFLLLFIIIVFYCYFPFFSGGEAGATGIIAEPPCRLECKQLTTKDYVDLLWTTLAEFPGKFKM